MSVVDPDILTIRKKNVEVVVRLVESFPGDWRVYEWGHRQCRNWSVTVGRRFASRFDALRFIQAKGYVIEETQSDGQSVPSGGLMQKKVKPTTANELDDASETLQQKIERLQNHAWIGDPAQRMGELHDIIAAVTEFQTKMLEALLLAQRALNTAPRFGVGDTDSYKIAAQVDEAIKATNTRREP